MSLSKLRGSIVIIASLSLSLAGCAPEGGEQLAPGPVTVATATARGPASALPTPLSPTATSAPTVTTPAEPVKVTILHTNDSRGYVDPCG